MERIPSLINRLKQRQEEGGTPTELLLMLEEIRAELNSTVSVADHTRSSISVWVPAGYAKEVQEKLPVGYMPDFHPPELKAVQPVAEKIFFDFEPEKEPEEVLERKEEPLRVFQGVPKPPVSIVEDEIDQNEQEGSTAEMEKEEPLSISYIHEVLAKAADTEIEKQEEKAANGSAEAPLVFELRIPEVEIPDQSPYTHDYRNPFEETEKFLSGKALATEAPAKPKEIHEILASRVVAKPENGPVVKKALADTLGGSKINDLKKAIGINDRFRFIKSLFRGDETLFDRSLKTINNFNILPEAQYWIQRELVIKLGWNDEDELVQQFYALVSRRFL